VRQVGRKGGIMENVKWIIVLSIGDNGVPKMNCYNNEHYSLADVLSRTKEKKGFRILTLSDDDRFREIQK
jgi:hypothetical protein